MQYDWQDPLLKEEQIALEELAADQGHSGARMSQVWRMAHGVGREEDAEGAAQILDEMDQADPVVQFNQGVLHLQGVGRPVNETEAARLFKLSADQGFAHAHRILGLLYEEGRAGLTKNLTQARLHLERGELGGWSCLAPAVTAHGPRPLGAS